MLSLELYKSYRWRSWTTQAIIYIVLLLLIIGYKIALNYLDEDSVFLKKLSFILLVCYILFILAKIILFWFKYESLKEPYGVLKIGTQNLCWHDEVIAWSQIESVQINYGEVEGKIDFGQSSFQNNRSDGINQISIRSKGGQIYQGWYKINPEQKKELLDLLQQAILSNNLDYNLAKSLLKPSNYQEHQQLKKLLQKK